WLHQRGELLPNLVRLGGTGVAVLIALRMVETGRPLLALAAAAAGWFWWKTQGGKTLGGKTFRGKTLAIGEAAKARALLGVARDADTDAIQAAWRRQMATAHPDAGGSAAAAQALTAARDLLLARQPE
ncbi:MAG: hypothetical protein H7268_15810, partial [Sandarakinorhabdus sp.]|nr:hypothetical protein [Sandarakinorhabdus sp.]